MNTPHKTDSTRLARALIRAASLLAPAHLRAEWREEWCSELWHESQRAAAERRNLIVLARGAFRDALAMWQLAGVAPAGGFRWYDPRGTGMMHELRQVLRGVRRNPAFTLLSVLTLALGLGANAALFTVIYAVLLRPMPYAGAERLVRIQHPVPVFDAQRAWPLSMHGFFQFSDNNRTLDGIGAYVADGANLASAEAPPERAPTAIVSATFFSVVRARAHLGRLLLAADNTPGSRPVVVLGYDFWKRRYGGSSSVLGRSIKVNGIEREVVGVAARGLNLPNASTDVWLPLQLNRSLPSENSHNFEAIGRLRTGVTVEEATADLARITAQFPTTMPGAYTAGFMKRFGFTARAEPLRSSFVGTAARGLWIVFGAVGLVLVIACANVANLFLVRTEGRRREIAVRAALGATRKDLARFFLTESVALALLAGVLGIGVGSLGVKLLIALAPAAVPRLDEISFGPFTALFTLGLALLVGLALGVLPLLRFGTRTSTQAMMEGSARQTVTRSGQRVRSVLVAAQIAFALVLLAGAGLLLKSFDRLRAVRPGFDPKGVITFEIALPRTYDRPARWNAFYQNFLERVNDLSGVVAAGGASAFPLKDMRGCFALFVPDVPLQPGEPPRCIPIVFATPGYFEALGITVDGHAFDWRDNAAHASGVVISRPLAQRLWPRTSALNRAVKVQGDRPPYYHVTGIATPVRAQSLTDPATEIAYFPIVPNDPEGNWFVPQPLTIAVRSTRTNPAELLPEIRRALAQVDPEVPIANVRMADEIVLRSMGRVTFVMLLIGIAAALALVLGTIGLYGVIAYVVGQRRAEIGIRMALGARSNEIMRLIVWQSMRIALAGVAAGVASALLLTRLMSSLLFEVSPADPITLAAVSLILLLVAIVASGAPARRAARVHPAETLRA